ncbi:hypothetical protein [Microvirga makkahensis]|uniref:Uncharacterized protein n=1 Tax=Microvirga makkahensis TaxID=1128670 RepID=A0A7X3MUT4_9HYPH|nr:hypothetical protein [Microvirga makkahensis]MXQ13614.1 hypothetical protein [Microvirga makkahensis]
MAVRAGVSPRVRRQKFGPVGPDFFGATSEASPGDEIPKKVGEVMTRLFAKFGMQEIMPKIRCPEKDPCGGKSGSQLISHHYKKVNDFLQTGGIG